MTTAKSRFRPVLRVPSVTGSEWGVWDGDKARFVSMSGHDFYKARDIADRLNDKAKAKSSDSSKEAK